MEEELLRTVRAYVEKAERRLDERRFDAAYDAYMDALHAIAGYLVYRDSGMLLSGKELMGMIRARYAEVYEVIARYEGVANPGEETTKALGDDVRSLMARVLPQSPPR